MTLIGTLDNEHIFHHIIDFMDPPLRYIASLTCSIWYKTIRDSVKFKDLESNDQAHLATSFGIEFLQFILQNFKIHKIVCGDYHELDNNNLCAFAAGNGNMECLEYLIENGYHLDQAGICTAGMAAKYGQMECMLYVIEKGCIIDFPTTELAAMGGHLKCLKYLIEIMDSPINRETTKFAAIGGSLECMKYLHGQNFKWDYNTCGYAAKYGHWECMKYAYEMIGCELVPWCAKEAANVGNSEILKYLKDNGCEPPADEGDIVDDYYGSYVQQEDNIDALVVTTFDSSSNWS